MEGSDKDAQLPLPSLAPKSAARISKLPSPTEAVFKNGPDGSENNHGSARVVNAQARTNSLWYAFYLPQPGKLNLPLQEKYLNQLAA